MATVTSTSLSVTAEVTPFPSEHKIVLKCTILQFYVSNDSGAGSFTCGQLATHLIDVHMVQV